MRTHDDVGDLAPAADEDADLPVDFPGKFRKLPGQFMAQDKLRRNPAPIELLDPSDLFRAEARGVAVDFADGSFLLSPGG
jgi:hypothetical protein